MNNKEKYLEIVNSRFDGKVKEILTKQINLFYKNEEVDINRYLKGEKVYLEKGTFIHGIYGGLENFDFTIENGFISADFTSEKRANKICNSVGMWNIQEDIFLKDYINLYSGFTITYCIGRGPESKSKTEERPAPQFFVPLRKPAAGRSGCSGATPSSRVRPGRFHGSCPAVCPPGTILPEYDPHQRECPEDLLFLLRPAIPVPATAAGLP